MGSEQGATAIILGDSSWGRQRLGDQFRLIQTNSIKKIINWGLFNFNFNTSGDQHRWCSCHWCSFGKQRHSQRLVHISKRWFSKLHPYILQFWKRNSPVQHQADFFPLCVFFFISGEFWRILPPGDHLVKAVSKDKRLQSTEFDVKVSLLQCVTSRIQNTLA